MGSESYLKIMEIPYFMVKKISTGVKELDRLLGGGINRFSAVLFIYDPETYGYILAFRILKNMIDNKYCCIVSNHSLPIDLLHKRLKEYIGLDMISEMKKKSLIVIDNYDVVRGFTKLEESLFEKYEKVLKVKGDSLDSTYVPKMIDIYSLISKNHCSGERGSIYLMYDLADVYEAFMATEKLDKASIKASKIIEKLYYDALKYRRSTDVIMATIDRSRVDRRFLSNMIKLADYTINVEYGSGDTYISWLMKPKEKKKINIRKYLERSLFE